MSCTDRTERIRDWTIEQAEYFHAQEQALLDLGLTEERAEEVALLEAEWKFSEEGGSAG